MLSRITQSKIARAMSPRKHAVCRWLACFRGVTAKLQVLGRCPESMAPDAGHYWSWYTAPMAASLAPFERVPRAFTMI